MGLPVDKLPVLEEFVSIQGEGRNIGLPYYFIRVGGCPLRCNFCDSEYTWKMQNTSVEDVDEVAKRAAIACASHNIIWVSVTGGEPLLYPKQMLMLMEKISEYTGHRVKFHIETSGRFYDKDVHAISNIYSVDAKTPCTGETMPGFFKGTMRSQDQVKCLIATESDFDYAHKLNEELRGDVPMILQPFNQSIVTDSTKNMDATTAAGRPTEEQTMTQIRRGMSVSLRWMLETYHRRCQQGERWQNVILTPQIHVLAYGNKPNT